MAPKWDFEAENFGILQKSYLDIVYCQNVIDDTLQHFETHFALFHHRFDRFCGDLLKKLRLGATLEARFRGSERGSTGSKKYFFRRNCIWALFITKMCLATPCNIFGLISRCFVIISICFGAICLRNYA